MFYIVVTQGELVLKIPWTRLFSSRIPISIRGLYLLAIPNDALAFDPNKEKIFQKDVKDKKEALIEAAGCQILYNMHIIYYSFIASIWLFKPQDVMAQINQKITISLPSLLRKFFKTLVLLLKPSKMFIFVMMTKSPTLNSRSPRVSP